MSSAQYELIHMYMCQLGLFTVCVKYTSVRLILNNFKWSKWDLNAAKHNDENGISGKYMLSICRMNVGKLESRGKKVACWGIVEDKVKSTRKQRQRTGSYVGSCLDRTWKCIRREQRKFRNNSHCRLDCQRGRIKQKKRKEESFFSEWIWSGGVLRRKTQ